MSIQSLLRHKVLAAFGSATLILLAAGAFSYHTMVVSRDSERWVQHTQQVLQQLHELVSSVSIIESSSRGYILTGEEVYLQSYLTSIASAKRHEAAVRNLSADNTPRSDDCFQPSST